MTDQLALAVDPRVTVVVQELRGDSERSLRIGPLPEPEARLLAALLLNRGPEPEGDGPWRCAIAGGRRTVHLTR